MTKLLFLCLLAGVASGAQQTITVLAPADPVTTLAPAAAPQEWVLIFYTHTGTYGLGCCGISSVVPMASREACEHLRGELLASVKEVDKARDLLECRDLVANPLKLKAG